jgi:FkbM family methyltransferase
MSQAVAMPSLKALIGQVLPVKVIDIGASPSHDTPPYAGLLRAGDAHIIGFEPNPQMLNLLNQTKGPNETYLPYAVGDGNPHRLNFCKDSGMTSLLQPNARVLNLFPEMANAGIVVSTTEIDTVRLDTIPETENVDMIKIDIQGAELMALKNGVNRVTNALVVQTEVEFLEMYVGQPLFSEVDLFMRHCGFSFHRFYPMVSRVVQPLVIASDPYAGISQILWADAIFIRDLTKLDVLSNAQLLKYATLLHDCYQSVDVVMHILVALDRRVGSKLGTAYLEGLQKTGAPIPQQ